MNIPAHIGKYRINSIIGRGAMGVVYKAYDQDIERVVAIKFINEQPGDNTVKNELMARFKQEAKAAARCLHPNIVAVFDFAELPQSAYIVMEYVEGIELKELLHREGKLSLLEASSVILQVLDALEYAHINGIVHRDIKPANIMVLNSGQVKVADFGVAKILDSNLTRHGFIIGTPNYMSPEAMLGKVVDQRSDLYSVGIVLFELLTGNKIKVDFLDDTGVRESIDSTFPNTSQNGILKALLTSALELNPIDRIESATAFSKQLRNLLKFDSGDIPDNSVLVETVHRTVSKNDDNSKLEVVPTAGTHPSLKETYSAETVNQIQQALVSHIGPVAIKLVENYRRQSLALNELLQSLSLHIPNKAERSQFIKRLDDSNLEKHAPNTGISSNDAGEKNEDSIYLSPEDISFITNTLRTHIGPLASVLLKKTLNSSFSIDDLIANLIKSIPNEQEASQFRNEVTKYFD